MRKGKKKRGSLEICLYYYGKKNTGGAGDMYTTCGLFYGLFMALMLNN